MDLGLSGRVGVVAAGSRGMGKAIALAFAREGMDVAVSARGAHALTATAREIEAFGGRVLPVQADMTVEGDIVRFVEEAAESLGQIDVLVTNAGGAPVRAFVELTDADWYSAFDLNLLSAVRLIRAALPHLERRHGSIVTITSIAVKQPVPGLVLSNAVRPGVIGLAKSLAHDFGPRNVRFNNILPGMIMTHRARELAERRARDAGRSVDDIIRQTEATIPLRRYGRPEDVANLALFLASDVSGYMTGTSTLVDGGLFPGLL